MMSGFEDQEENPAEPVPDVATAAEPPQPPEPGYEDEALVGEEETPMNVSASDNETSRNEVPSGTADSGTNRTDRFSQTFVKYAKNLPTKRLVEIINTQIDHERNSLVFYCTSQELLRSFEDGVNPRKIQ